MAGHSMISPIPRKLLPLSVEVFVPIDGARGGEVDEPIEISGVRIDRNRDFPADEARTDGRTATMYVDAVNSSGAFEIPVGSKVEADGHRYAVVACERFETFYGTVHHWEVGLK